MKVPYLNLGKQFDDPEILARVGRVLASGQFVLGAGVEAFEARFAGLCQVSHALGVNSGTDALFLALKVLGVGRGDEVITVSNSFVATAGAIAAAGARPVFVDVGPDYQMDPGRIGPAVTPRTRAVVPVHLTGTMADMEAIGQEAASRGLFVLEDAAQAVGASWDDKPAGAWGEAGCFSLHPLKNLNAAGDGGMVTTQSPGLAEKIQKLRNHGLRNRDEVEFFGYNSRLDALQAAILDQRLNQLAETTRKRRENAALYDRLLAGLAPQVVLPPRSPRAHAVFHTYVVRVKERELLLAALEQAGVQARVHYPIPIHLQLPARELGWGPGDLPETERQAAEIVSLPVHQDLEPEQIEYVCQTIRSFYQEAAS